MNKYLVKCRDGRDFILLASYYTIDDDRFLSFIVQRESDRGKIVVETIAAFITWDYVIKRN